MPEHYTIPEQVSFALARTLPGFKAQKRMAPSNRPHKPEMIGGQSTLSAILIPLYPRRNEWYTCFMIRTIDKTVHSGQISFPGGKYEPDDILLYETACREAREELNIHCDIKNLAGELSSLFIPASRYYIQPFVACLNQVPDFKPNPNEVAGIIECSITDLFDDQNKKEKIFLKDGKEVIVPYYQIGEYHIWGATAMIISEMEQMLKKYNVFQDKPNKIKSFK